MTTDIELADRGFTKTAWIAPLEDLEFEEWAALGLTLQQIDFSLPWWIGDWLNYGEWAFGEMYAQASEITGMEVSRLTNYKWIASKVERSVRIEELSWSHHRAVAAFAPEIQSDWLDQALTNGWSVNELIRKIQQENNAILQPPDLGENGQEPDEDEPEQQQTLLVSPVRRLRYATRILLERHLHVAPYDVDHTAVIQAQNAVQETEHAENEDLDDE